MEDEDLELEIDGKTEHYKVLFKVEIEGDRCYILYTKEARNEVDEIIVHAGYFTEEGEDKYIEPVTDDETLEFLSNILVQIQNQVGKDKGE